MTKLHVGSLLGSAALAVILLVLLFVYTDLDIGSIGRLLSGIRSQAFVETVLLLGFNNLLAGEKWRLIAARLHHADGEDNGENPERHMPRLLYFAFTSIGVALGQILPASLTLVFSRSIGAHLYGGRPLVRGVVATVFDYSFDLLVALFLACSSVLVLVTGAGGLAWGLYMLGISTAGFLLYGVAARLAAGAARTLGAGGRGRFHLFCTTLAHSPLLVPGLGRCLLAISALRVAVTVLISVVSANAIALDLPIWRLAAALPFAMIANALAITPGGLGINEWSISSALFALGTPFPVAAQWALVNRVLVTVAAGVCGVGGILIAFAAHSARRAV